MKLSILKIAAVVAALYLPTAQGAAVSKRILLDPVFQQQLKQENALVQQGGMAVPFAAENVMPFAEHDEAGYLVFSGDYDFNSFNVKLAMVKNLPADVQVIIYSDQGPAGIERIRSQFSPHIDAKRLHVVYIPYSSWGFWSRDGLPIPLWVTQNDGSKNLRVVDAKYYHEFEEDAKFAAMFGADMIRHELMYEGGNYMPNSLGACLTIDNELTESYPDDFFTGYYGCKKLFRMPWTKGIGHVDETARFISDDTIITDEPQYVSTFEQAGYRVVQLPRPNRELETYVNILMINKTVYLPIFGQAKDQEVIDIFTAEGFKVVPVNTVTLANEGAGSIHCITMTYPKLPLATVMSAMGAVY